MPGSIECLLATNRVAQRCAKACEERGERREQFARSDARPAIRVPPRLDCLPRGSGNARLRDDSALRPAAGSEFRWPCANSRGTCRPAARRPATTMSRKPRLPGPWDYRRRLFPFPRTRLRRASRTRHFRRHRRRLVHQCIRAPAAPLLPLLVLSVLALARVSNLAGKAGYMPGDGESWPGPSRTSHKRGLWLLLPRIAFRLLHTNRSAAGPHRVRMVFELLANRKWERKQCRAFQALRRGDAFRRSVARFGRAPESSQERVCRTSFDCVTLREPRGMAKAIRDNWHGLQSDIKIDSRNRGFIPRDE